MNIVPDITLGEKLNSFYEEYNLGKDGGVDKPRVRIDMTSWFHFYIPNPPIRKKAVLKHDMHHMITGYKGDMKGETEISAWEVGSNCKNYWAAWFLDLSGFMMGILFNPVNVYKAFIRGRNSKNLYYEELTDQQAKAMTLPDLQEFIQLPKEGAKLKTTITDVLLFLWWIFVGLTMTVMSVVLIPIIILYNLFVFADIALRGEV